MAQDETYNGWTNRETWAVALHINNDQGWQESVHEAVRMSVDAYENDVHELDKSEGRRAAYAGDYIRENVEETLELILQADAESGSRNYMPIREDIGSLWRVNWTELGASFLEDIEESDDEEPPYFGEELHDDAEDE